MIKRVIAALAVALAGCGGGGGGDAAASAEGFWDSDNLGVLIANTGEFWAVGVSGNSPYLLAGNISVSGSSLSGQFNAYAPPLAIPGTLTGTITEKSKIAGTVSALGVTGPLTLTYFPGYDTAASLANIAGTYTPDGGGTVTISSSGALVGVNAGCTATGSVAPDPSGKNFYRLTLNLGPAPCGAPNSTGSGVLIQSDKLLIGGAVIGNIGVATVLLKR